MKNNLLKLISLSLVLCLLLTAFAGCKKKKDKDTANTSSSSLSDDIGGEDEDLDDDFEDDFDDEYDDIFEDFEDDIDDDDFDDDDYDDGEDDEDDEEDDELSVLTVHNTQIAEAEYLGMGFIHQMFSRQPDAYNRTYTEDLLELEEEYFKNLRVKNIRAFYGSTYTWDVKEQKHDFNPDTNPRMKAFYDACKAMEKIGVTVGVTAQWDFKYLAGSEPGIGKVGNDDMDRLAAPGLIGANYNETMAKYKQFMKDSVLSFKKYGVNNVKQFFCYTECNNAFNASYIIDQDFRVTEGTTIEKRQYDKLIPFIDKAFRTLDSALKDAGVRNNYQIVGPCDSWRSDENGHSILTDYAIKNLSDIIDIIGNHAGYDIHDDYTKDVFYQFMTEEYPEISEQIRKYETTGKQYWYDETNVGIESAFGSHESLIHPWKGVALGSYVSSIMNHGGINAFFLWTLFSEQWPDATPQKEKTGWSEFWGGIQTCGYIDSLNESIVPFNPYYAVSLMSRYIGQGKTFKCDVDYSLYISAIERTDGEITVMVTNYDYFDANFKISFDKSLGGRTFYRHLYTVHTVKPVEGADFIGVSAVAKNVKTAIYDTIPAGSVAIYTTDKT